MSGWQVRLMADPAEYTPKSEARDGRPISACTQLKVTAMLGALVQVQVQVCFTSVCGQVQPLDVAPKQGGGPFQLSATHPSPWGPSLAAWLCTGGCETSTPDRRQSTARRYRLT
jgi:hypothetical protein